MKQTLIFSVAACLLASALIGCKPKADNAAAPPATTAQTQTTEAPAADSSWTVEPAVSANSSDAGDDWRRSPYAPAADVPAPGYSEAAEPADAGAEYPPASDAAPIDPPGYAAADVVSPPAYDPALDAPGLGRPRSASATPHSLQAPAQKSANPLRIGSYGSEPDPNPLRNDQPPAVRSFSSAPYRSSLSEPAGGSAPSPGVAPSDVPTESYAPPAASAMRMNTFSAERSFEPEAAMTPGSAAPAETYAEPQEDRSEASNMAMMAMGEPPVSTPPEPATGPANPPANASNLPYDTVKVFYGTDRLAWQPNQDTWASIGIRYWPTLAAVFATVLFGFIAAMWRHWMSATLSICSLLAAVVIGYTATSETLERVRIAKKEGVRYVAERSSEGQVQLGICEVTIPKTHAPGELEAPSIIRMEVREDDAKHVILQKTEQLADAEFYGQLRERVASSRGEELFVFVHGFNVSFENAARRTAQMAHDLKYDGAPVFFSWPANEKFLLTYAQDETNVSWAAPHLKKFLLDVARGSNAKSINLVAHSMGNRALTTVLRELELELREESRLFNQVVLAAPDIDADDFRQNIAPFIQKTSKRITLYASSNDQALAASQLVHRYPRAGDSGQVLVVVPGIETVDVSAIDGGPWGHSYYGSSDPILKDLAVLFAGADSSPRSWLLAQDLNGVSYWVFQAQAASARAAIEGGPLR